MEISIVCQGKTSRIFWCKETLSGFRQLAIDQRKHVELGTTSNCQKSGFRKQ